MKYAMFIDDDEHYLYVIKRLHKRNKIPNLRGMVTAGNGQEALDYLLKNINSNLPEAMFVDINMPVMGGVEFLEEFNKKRSEFKELESIEPIAVVTSSTNERDRNEIKQHSFVDNYLLKDVDIDELAETIDKLLV